jgi:hypothetical protein
MNSDPAPHLRAIEGGAARRRRGGDSESRPGGGPEGLLIDSRRWVRVLALTAATLLVLSVTAKVLEYIDVERYSWTVSQIAPHFDVDIEGSVPTWFSNLLLGFAAVQLLVIGHLRRKRRGASGAYWTVLGVTFALMSADEITGFHNTPFVSEESARSVSDFLAIPWVVQGMVVVAIFGLAYVRFLLTLPRATMLGLMRAGLVYVGGALIMEMVGAHFIVNYGYKHPIVSAILTLEEGMEMFGVILLISTLFRYIEREFPRVGVSLAADAEARG